MKAYEFPAKVTSEGKLELPDVQLRNILPDTVARVIVLIEESVDQAGVEENTEGITLSFRKALHEAKIGQTKPITRLWDELDAR